MTQINDFDIQALVDNELNWEDEKRVLSAIQSDPKAMSRLQELKAQKLLLQNWWKQKHNQ